MERCVDHLAELAKTEISPADFLGQVLIRLKTCAAARGTRFWRPSPSGGWEPAGHFPEDLSIQTDLSSDTDEQRWFADSAKTRQLVSRTFRSDRNGDTRRTVRTVCPIVHAGQVVGLLDVSHDLPAQQELSPDIAPFLRVISEITADFLSQAELRQLRQSRAQWQIWDQVTIALMRSNSLSELAATIVNDGRVAAECDRITVLKRSGSRFETLAMTGVERVEPRSNTVGSLQTIAQLVADSKEPRFFVAPTGTESDDSADIKCLVEHARLTGARIMGLIPIPREAESSESASSSAPAVMVFEQFQEVTDNAAWRARAQLLANRCQPLLLAALERESIPFYHTLLRWRHVSAMLRQSRLWMVALLIGVLVTILMVVPAELTVTGRAELVPERRREIFASSSGIVDQLFVQHGDDVDPDQPLIVLRDPQLELEFARINGEIEVVRERLKGVLAARLAGGATPDAANRARLLASEEEELKERQQTLNRQRSLIEQQQSALTLKSPIGGKVLTWDVATLLSARPVERGQALLTIGDTNGPWIVELRIADEDFGHVRRAQKRLTPELDVDFLLASDPSRSYRGKVRHVAEATTLDDQLGVSVMLTIAIEPNQITDPHAGTTVIPRIHCGRESLGYVWLHDLIDAVRSRLLF
jgi:biotin carboxyl carrier protein